MENMKDYIRRFRRLIKVLIRKDLWVRPDCHIKSVRFGSEYAGWNVNTDKLDRKSIIYSVGVGEDISFDIALIEMFNVTIHAFDPTPKSIEWCKNQDLPSNFILHEYGIANFDGNALFYPPENPNHVSHTLLEKTSTKAKSIEVPVRKLETIMKKLGHNHIDVLKMDIEGAEYAVINDMKSSNILPNQLLIEFHHRFPNVGIEKTKDALNTIRSMGYGLFFVSASGEEYGFIQKSG